MLEQSEQYAQDKQYAKAVRAVYKKGDMPKSARDAYERLAPLVGPEKSSYSLWSPVRYGTRQD